MWRMNVAVVVFWDFLEVKAYVWNITDTVITVQSEGIPY